MATEEVLINLQKLENEFILEFGLEIKKEDGSSYSPKRWKRSGAYEKYATLVINSNNTQELIVIEGTEENGVNNSVTILTHWLFDGILWQKKSTERLRIENQNVLRFIEGQGFNIYTASWKYCKIENGQIIFLDNELDKDIIWHNGNEIMQEKLQEDGTSFEPKQYESKEPKEYEKILNSNITNAYEVYESIIRPTQLAEIAKRYN